MAENDIYDSKGKYERFKNRLDDLAINPKDRKDKKKVKYYCKNKKNLEYFRKLFLIMDARDPSYIHRIRLLRNLVVICYATEKDLAECERDDINSIVAYMHTVYKTPKIKADFIRDLKFLWRVLFTEKD